MGVPCVLYMLSAPGPRHAVNITENSSSRASDFGDFGTFGYS